MAYITVIARFQALLYCCNECDEQYVDRDDVIQHLKQEHQAKKLIVSVTVLDASGEQDTALNPPAPREYVLYMTATSTDTCTCTTCTCRSCDTCVFVI